MTAVWRWFRRGLYLAALAYLGAAAWLYFHQRDLLYFPRPLSAPVADQAFAVASQGLELHGWVINPGKRTALVYFGGNGEQVERESGFFRALLPDVSVYLLPYRGYSGNPGLPSEAALFADALKAFDAIAAKHAQVDAMGRSLGSGVAVYLAAHRPVHRLVLVTPFDSIENVAQAQYPMFPIRFLLTDKFESWRLAGTVHAPCLVLVAGDDRVIPRPNTEFLVAHMAPDPIEVVIPGAGHNSISDDARYSEAIGRFLRN